MKRKKMTGIDDPSRELEAALDGLAKVEMVYSIPSEELKRKLARIPATLGVMVGGKTRQ
ncbi:MAG: hypothetical protein ACU0BB_08575 [Paracoccaceae bacterium]